MMRKNLKLVLITRAPSWWWVPKGISPIVEQQPVLLKKWNKWSAFIRSNIIRRRFNFFKVYQNLVITSPFSIFLPHPFLPCKNTFMDDYDGI
jgi:hypothetical protein